MTTPEIADLRAVISERQRQVAEAVRRFQALYDTRTDGPAPKVGLDLDVDLGLLNGLVVFEETPEARTTLRFSLTPREIPVVHQVQEHRVAARGDTPAHRVNVHLVSAPSASFWRSEVFGHAEGCGPTFGIQVVAGDCAIRATLDGVEEWRVPADTIPLSALSTVIAACPGETPEHMAFTVLDESAGIVVSARLAVQARTQARVRFGLAEARVPTVQYEHRIGDAPAFSASYLAIAPHVCLRHVTGIILPKVHT
jgi:hypothetical protein